MRRPRSHRSYRAVLVPEPAVPDVIAYVQSLEDRETNGDADE